MSDKIYDAMNWPEIEAVVYGEEASPRDLMGPRVTPDGVLIQGFFPDAVSVRVVTGSKTYEMTQEDEAGYFAALLPLKRIPKYRYQVDWGRRTDTFADAYAFPGQISEEEEKAFCAGVYYQVYEKLGAHPMTVNGVKGTYFAVWAPNALRVSVVGNFNRWDGRRLPMHRMPMSGIFELFVPQVGEGVSYQYELRVKGGRILHKSDPYGTASEMPPKNASVVTDLSGFVWNDQAWYKTKRGYDSRNVPVSIFETDLIQWESGEKLIDFAKDLGYTHVEFTPVMEYLGDSPYSTSSYYAPTARFGSPADFQKLVDALHQEGIGVILDWTPAQFPAHESGLKTFSGTPLYEVPDPALAVHPMWGTMLYNYGSPMVTDFLIGNALFWITIYHVDGLRMDDVDAMLYLDYGRRDGEWRPNIFGTNENLYAMEFLKHLNSIVKKKAPGTLLIAQEDGLWPELTDSVENDHLGFDYKWNGTWTGELLQYLSMDPIFRKNHHDELTLSMLYAYCEHYILTLGKRDIGSMADFREKIFGTEKQKEAQVRAALAWQMAHPGCKMTAPEEEIDAGLRDLIRDLNQMYRQYPALSRLDHSSDGFEWIQNLKAEENILAFLRKTEKADETLLVVCNFAAVAYEDYRVGVPFEGKYKEILNTDSEKYGGAGVVNPRMKSATKRECDNRECSLRLRLPALGVSIFTCTSGKKATKEVSGRRTKAAEKTAAPEKKRRGRRKNAAEE